MLYHFCPFIVGCRSPAWFPMPVGRLTFQLMGASKVNLLGICDTRTSTCTQKSHYRTFEGTCICCVIVSLVTKHESEKAELTIQDYSVY